MAMNEYLIDGRASKNGDFLSELIKKVKKSSIFTKIKSVRNIGIYCVIALALVIALVVNGVGAGSGRDVVSSTDIEDTEERLASVLNKIAGVGDVKVMISYEGGMKKVIAYDVVSSNDKTTTGDKNTEYISENRSPVTVSVSGASSPLVLQELKPEITGVIVVAEGASNLKVKLDLTSAVKTVLNISSEKVEVFTMNN